MLLRVFMHEYVYVLWVLILMFYSVLSKFYGGKGKSCMMRCKRMFLRVFMHEYVYVLWVLFVGVFR